MSHRAVPFTRCPRFHAIWKGACRFLALAAVCAPLVTPAAWAGIADTPLPTFSDGKPSVLVHTVTGVIGSAGLNTVFLCTSFDSVPVDVGVEIFDATGSLATNPPAGGTGSAEFLDLGPGQTVTFATNATVAFLETSSATIVGVNNLAKGSARVVASSPNVRCNVMLLDDLATPPTALANLGRAVRPSAGALPPTVALPVFPDAQTATHAILFPGTVKRVDVETAFFCTSLASTPIDIGVEVFDNDGTLANDVTAGQGVVLGVGPGQTVLISTALTAAFSSEDTVILTASGSLPPIDQGMARVVSNSPDVACSAVVVDAGLAIPTSMTGLAARRPGASTPTLPAALPTFGDGKAAVHVMTIPGVMKRGQLQTVVMCTSVAPNPVDIGLEVFDLDGGLVNDISANVGAVLGVAPGATVSIATSTTAALAETVVIPTTNKLQGVGRVVASSDQVVCSAMVVDDAVTPPATATLLGDGQQPLAGARPATVSLPVFSDGKPATHAIEFPGLTKRVDVETDILCTSLASTNVDIGLEVFATDGHIANGDNVTGGLAAGNGALIDVPPGSTVTIGTTGTAALFEKTVVNLPGIAQGMGRLVATSDQILCSGLMLDAGLAPPTSMARLLGTGAGSAVCGDNVVQPGEQCDGTDDAACPGQCDSGCLCPPVCGDNFVQAGEQCDDGNTVGGDCCSATCQFEPLGSVCPDDGNLCNGPESCNGAGVCVSGPAVDCDDGNLCTVDTCVPATGTCINDATPATTCLSAGVGQLQIKDHPTKPKDQIKWKWQRGDAVTHGALGNPANNTTYTLCIYDHTAGVPTLVSSLTLPPSALWVERAPKGWKFKDKLGTNDGIQQIQLRPGNAGKTKVQFKAKGVVPIPAAISSLEMLDVDPKVTVQLFGSNISTCWTSSFTTPLKNTATQFKAKFKAP